MTTQHRDELTKERRWKQGSRRGGRSRVSLALARESMAAQAGTAPARGRTDRGTARPLPPRDLGAHGGSCLLGLMFLTLFTVFGRPDIGLIFDAVVLLPIVVVAWLDHALLARRARRYLAELSEYLREKELQTRGGRQRRNDLGASLSSFRGREVQLDRHRTAHDQARSSMRRRRRARSRRPRSSESSSWPSVHSWASATDASSASLSRFRAVCSRRLTVPSGTSSISAISISEWPRM